ncbi:response regulator transcription factor [Halorussus sp. AFM4]|uniref:response regulator transcription factor n=1 Tax=Halorussus sp. AFM4 TaxID=3421651 RepID=UPI003EBD22BA
MTGSPTTVLAVDDDPDVAEMYAAWLDDCAVETAAGGREALGRASEDVDVMLLDRQMPDLSGDETLRRLRRRGFRFPVAMVTAVEPDVDVVELGFDAYVCKPVRGDELRETVADLRRRAAYDAELREYFALASKRAALRSSLDDEVLRSSEKFHRLTETFEAAAERANASRDDLLADAGFEETLRRTVDRPEDG